MRKLSNKSSRLAKNALLLYVLTFSNYFLGLLLYPYLTRVLSIEGFGLVGFSMAYVLVFQVIVEFGFMISTTASISRNRSNIKKVSGIVSSVIYAKTLLAIGSATLFILSMIFVPILREHFFIVSLFLISSILSAMLPDFYFRGMEKMKIITLRTVGVRLLSLLLVMVLVHEDSQIVLIPLSFIVCNIAALYLTIREMRKQGVEFKHTKLRRAIDDIKESSMFFLSRLAVGFNQSIGTFLIGLKFAPTSIEVGVLSGALRISLASEMMLFPVSESLYPHMVNKKDYNLFTKIIMLGGVAWLIVCLIAFIFANWICEIILGPEYAIAGDYLRILLFGNFMAFFSNMFGYNALVPIGKSNHANVALLISAGVNVLAFAGLWLTNSVSLVSVCIIMTLTNFVVFGYRGYIFWKNKHLANLPKAEEK